MHLGTIKTSERMNECHKNNIRDKKDTIGETYWETIFHGFLRFLCVWEQRFFLCPSLKDVFISTVLEDRDGVFLHGKGLVLWLGDPL